MFQIIIMKTSFDEGLTIFCLFFQIYENHSAIVIRSRQQTSEQQRAGSDVEEADHENITSEGVYCNEPLHKTHRVKY